MARSSGLGMDSKNPSRAAASSDRPRVIAAVTRSVGAAGFVAGAFLVLAFGAFFAVLLLVVFMVILLFDVVASYSLANPVNAARPLVVRKTWLPVLLKITLANPLRRSS